MITRQRINLPLATCKTCRFAHNNEEKLMCFVDPPFVLASTGVLINGVRITRNRPACQRYREFLGRVKERNDDR